MPIIVTNSPVKKYYSDLILHLDEFSRRGNRWSDNSPSRSSATLFGTYSFVGGFTTDGTNTTGTQTIPINYASGTLTQVPTPSVNDFTISVTFTCFGPVIDSPDQNGQTLFVIPGTISGNTNLIGFRLYYRTILNNNPLLRELCSISITGIPPGSWHTPIGGIKYNQKTNFTVTYNNFGKVLRLFVNGVLVTTQSSINLTLLEWGDKSYMIGAWGVTPNATRPFYGTIHNVTMFKRTLTPDEVLELYKFKPTAVSTKKSTSDIILNLSNRGTSTGWADNSIYSNGARILGNATFSNGLITNGSNVLGGARGEFTVPPGQSFTISSWVRLDNISQSTRNTILSTALDVGLGNNIGTDSNGFIFSLLNDRSISFLAGENTNLFEAKTSQNQFSFNETFNVTVKFHNLDVTFYKNGNLISTHSLNKVFNWNNLGYGINYWGFNNDFFRFNGKVFSVVVYDRDLSNDEIRDLYFKSATTYKPSESTLNQPPHGGKLLYIDAGEPKSYYLTGTTVNDLSIYGRNGTFSSFESSGLPTFGTMNGGYFSFKDGSSIGFNPTGLPTNGESTIIVWVRITQSTGNIQTIFIYGGSGGSLSSRSIVVSSDNKFVVTVDSNLSGSNKAETTGNFVQLNKWYQVVQVNKSSNISSPQLILYVNGKLIGSIGTSRQTILSNARIGRNGIWSSEQYPLFGDVGELTIYDRALDAQEIYQDYKVKRNRYGLEEVIRLPSTVVPTIPSVITLPVTVITTISAQSGVEVTNNGFSQIGNSGVIWSINQNSLLPSANPFSLLTKTTDGSGLISNLSPGTIYYVVAYAQNSTGIGYGAILQFTTVAILLPTVQNVRGTSLYSTQIRATASVVSLGNAASISSRGFIYNTGSFSANTPLNSFPTVEETGNFVLGTYSLLIENLNGGTSYWIRAFATNQAGTDLSDDILQINTLPTPTVVILEIYDVESLEFTVDIQTTGDGRTRQGIVVKTDIGEPDITIDEDFYTEVDANLSSHTATGRVASTTYYVWGFVRTGDGRVFYTSTSKTVTTLSVV
jgi:hypothetical protein